MPLLKRLPLTGSKAYEAAQLTALDTFPTLQSGDSGQERDIETTANVDPYRVPTLGTFPGSSAGRSNDSCQQEESEATTKLDPHLAATLGAEMTAPVDPSQAALDTFPGFSAGRRKRNSDSHQQLGKETPAYTDPEPDSNLPRSTTKKRKGGRSASDGASNGPIAEGSEDTCQAVDAADMNLCSCSGHCGSRWCKRNLRQGIRPCDLTRAIGSQVCKRCECETRDCHTKRVHKHRRWCKRCATKLRSSPLWNQPHFINENGIFQMPEQWSWELQSVARHAWMLVFACPDAYAFFIRDRNAKGLAEDSDIQGLLDDILVQSNLVTTSQDNKAKLQDPATLVKPGELLGFLTALHGSGRGQC